MSDRYTEPPRSHAASGSDRNTQGPTRDEQFNDAVRRFESAVEGLASTARDRFGDRATRLVEEVTSRIEREVHRQSRRHDRRERRRERKGYVPEAYLDERVEESPDETATGRARRGVSMRTDRIYRNRYRRKIAGVCSGVAAYFGMQTWVVRGLAITGALFFPMIVIPAYFIGMIFLPELPRGSEGVSVGQSSASNSGTSAVDPGPGRPQSGNVRRDFRDTQALLSQAELRLRRMEAHVTSDRFELQKELHRLEQGEPNGGAVA